MWWFFSWLSVRTFKWNRVWKLRTLEGWRTVRVVRSSSNSVLWDLQFLYLVLISWSELKHEHFLHFWIYAGTYHILLKLIETLQALTVACSELVLYRMVVLKGSSDPWIWIPKRLVRSHFIWDESVSIFIYKRLREHRVSSDHECLKEIWDLRSVLCFATAILQKTYQTIKGHR